jgi:hypothetical protein
VRLLGEGQLAVFSARRVTRRRLLAGVAGGIGGLAFVGLLPALEGLLGKPLGAPELTHGAFAGLVGTTFRVSLAQGRTATLRLLSVRTLAAPGGRWKGPLPTGDGFAPLFSGSLSEGFGQGTYTVGHRSLGSFAMFLVPVGPAGPDQRYEAVFNRMWK